MRRIRDELERCGPDPFAALAVEDQAVLDECRITEAVPGDPEGSPAGLRLNPKLVRGPEGRNAGTAEERSPRAAIRRSPPRRRP